MIFFGLIGLTVVTGGDSSPPIFMVGDAVNQKVIHNSSRSYFW